MKSLNTLTGDALEQMIDYKVVDQTGASIGTLHSLWSDPATGTVEFLGVKTGWLFGHNHVVPAEKAELDDANNVVRLPYTEVFVKEAPTMSADAEISEGEEDDIFRYYGLPRRGAAGTAAETPAGTAAAGAGVAGIAAATSAEADEDEMDSSATFVGLPTKLKGAPSKEISITDRGETSANSYRLRKTSRPDPVPGVPADEPRRESLSTLSGMTEPASDDFINGGAAAVTRGVGAGVAGSSVSTMATSSGQGTAESGASPVAKSSDYAPTTSGPLGDTSLTGSTGGASDIGGNTMTTLTTGTEEYTSSDETRPFGLNEPSENIDPITGEHGAHAVGTGVGAAGAGAAGLAIGGMVGGPIGAVVGGIVGAIGGGLAGKGVAESVNPTLENEHWQSNYTSAPYYERDYQYEDYEPAYRLGYEGYGRHGGTSPHFEDVEPELARQYEQTRGSSKLGWDKAKHATQDAWDRVKGKFAANTTPPRS